MCLLNSLIDNVKTLSLRGKKIWPDFHCFLVNLISVYIFHNFRCLILDLLFFPFLQLFEGMKAYRGVDGKIRIFRPNMNMNRMNLSAKRSGLPTFDGDEYIKSMQRLVSIDQEWVPHTEKASLYIRPTLIGIDVSMTEGNFHNIMEFNQMNWTHWVEIWLLFWTKSNCRSFPSIAHPRSRLIRFSITVHNFKSRRRLFRSKWKNPSSFTFGRSTVYAGMARWRWRPKNGFKLCTNHSCTKRSS